MTKAIYILLVILLSACAATTPVPSATPKAMNTVAPKASSTPTVTVTITVQPTTTDTAIPTETPEIDLTDVASNVKATKIAEFSINCNASDGNRPSLSPNQNWLAVSCGYKRDQTLEAVNHAGKRWVLQFKDYLLKKDLTDDGETPMGSLYPVQWSQDENYLYFASHISYDGGGTCFYGFGVEGLYRLTLNDGTVSAILPINEIAAYDFSFSPTGRRLAYQGNGKNLTILDLQTGSEITIDVGKHSEYESTGNLTWSPDGLELAYATCEATQDYQNNYFIKKSAIKIFSIKQQASRTILEMTKIMLFIENWNSADTLEILQSPYGISYDGTLQLLNLNTHQLMTPTPTPQP